MCVELTELWQWSTPLGRRNENSWHGISVRKILNGGDPKSNTMNVLGIYVQMQKDRSSDLFKNIVRVFQMGQCSRMISRTGCYATAERSREMKRLTT